MTKSASVFLYGFKPFRNFSENVTEQIINAVPQRAGLETCVFDVVFDSDMFLQPLITFKPSIVLGLGMSSKAKQLCIEQCAVNSMGHDGEDTRLIHEEGDACLTCSVQLPESKETMVSDDAGTYVCNFSMYTYLSQTLIPDLQYGFLHVPESYSVSAALAYLAPLLDDWLR